MALKDTCKTIKGLLECIRDDLEKAEAGNKAAAQRVRTDSIKLEKAAKLYRKESIKDEKKGAERKWAKRLTRSLKPRLPKHLRSLLALLQKVRKNRAAPQRKRKQRQKLWLGKNRQQNF